LDEAVRGFPEFTADMVIFKDSPDNRDLTPLDIFFMFLKKCYQSFRPKFWNKNKGDHGRMIGMW
jgi:hypothetical protein